MLELFIEDNQLNSNFKKTALEWFIPLADRLVQIQSKLKHTFFVGINGCQGSGKSTLAQFLVDYIQTKHPLSVAVLSLDDFYLDQSARQILADKIHPLYKVRGVPGTHDTQLIKRIFSALTESDQTIALPKFCKALDNPVTNKDRPLIQTPVDIVLMEGWCWGVPAQQQEMLKEPVNDLEKQHDQYAIWRKSVNKYIEQEYLPLYQQMNYWLMLKAPDFSYVLKWRLEQERKLAMANQTAENIMSKQQVGHFINHYQRLTEYALDIMPSNCNEVYYLDGERNIIQGKIRDWC